MDKKVALVVIYNHNFERNIEKIKTIYGSRFSTILQIMPFYRGDDPTVIGVYEAAWQFNGYLAQALPRLLQEKGFSHYLIIGDDLILSPALNEHNACEMLGLGEEDAYIHDLTLANEGTLRHTMRVQYTYSKILWPENKCEFQRFIPSLEEARAHCTRHGFDWKQGLQGYTLHHSLEKMRMGTRGINLWLRIRMLKPVAAFCAWLERGIRKLFRCKVDEAAIARRYNQMATSRKLSAEPYYPIFNGFSDIMVIPAHRMAEFAHLCGVFAASRMFVENAIPTAMIFTLERVRTERDTPYKNVIAWGQDRDDLLAKHDCSYASLMAGWPEHVLYLHPIKLSQWKLDI